MAGAVFGPEASDDQVYVQSGCHKVVASVCQGCNGELDHQPHQQPHDGSSLRRREQAGLNMY
jgi:hypothetical protein